MPDEAPAPAINMACSAERHPARVPRSPRCRLRAAGRSLARGGPEPIRLALLAAAHPLGTALTTHTADGGRSRPFDGWTRAGRCPSPGRRVPPGDPRRDVFRVLTSDESSAPCFPCSGLSLGCDGARTSEAGKGRSRPSRPAARRDLSSGRKRSRVNGPVKIPRSGAGLQPPQHRPYYAEPSATSISAIGGRRTRLLFRREDGFGDRAVWRRVHDRQTRGRCAPPRVPPAQWICRPVPGPAVLGAFSSRQAPAATLVRANALAVDAVEHHIVFALRETE